MNQTTNQTYRPDIDGLRAIAVGAVLVFHAFPAALPGGFVGVDIFFVISGFLISRIIFSSLEKGTFKFLDFYARRIKRIYPALLLVLTATMAFGWITLFAGEYERLGKHVASGAAFVSNFVLWQESGYFDATAMAKPLLHLWSLGVEEQFYIFWPLFLWVAWRYSSNFLLMTGVVALLSFGANLLFIGAYPSTVFYFPFTRFWELMAGAMLAYVITHRSMAPAGGVRQPTGPLHLRASLLSLIGIGMLVLSILFVREKNFPGWQALVPTLGTLLLIAAGPDAFVNRRILSSRTMVGIGLISYPLYLWHWPLISYVTIIQGEVAPAMRAGVLGASVLLAWATYRLVERPLKKVSDRRVTTMSLSLAMVAIGGVGLGTYFQQGAPERPVVRMNRTLATGLDGGYPTYAGPCAFLKSEQIPLFYCAVDTRETPRFALLGDSKALALFSGLFRTSQPGGTWLVLGSGDSGPLVPILTDDRRYAYVKKNAVASAIQQINDMDSVHTVVVATAARALFQLQNDFSISDLPASKNYAVAFEGLDAAVSRLVAKGKQVVLLVDNPTLPHMENCIDRATSSAWVNRWLAKPSSPDCRVTVLRQRELSAQYLELLGAVARAHPGRVRIVDSLDVLCDDGVCMPTKNGRFVYQVTDHISDYGATLVGGQLNQSLRSDRREVPPLEAVSVKNWGPRDTRVGRGANVQPNGASVLWMQVENVSRFGEVLVYFGEQGLKRVASVGDKVLTVDIPPEVIGKAGQYALVLEEASGRRTRIGVFSVSP
ncbi:acyltransferase family protein [Variovorax boronicumulans]|uniref:acyltransferase family protein n=1 Tax=Variovorax boronicumulans TaxID=436515 RepID=UPI001C568CEF